jgi:purine-binding chemotaxis protein CheW
MSESTSASPTDARWDDLARSASIGHESGEDADLLQELLSFEVGDTAYAVPIERVREILRMRPITPVPRVPDLVCGVISIRGEVVEVIDLRRRFGLPPAEPDRRTRIVVIHGFDGRVTGCMVDGVREVLRVPEDEIRPAPEADADTVSGLCKRGDEFVSMLDLDKVLDIQA